MLLFRKKTIIIGAFLLLASCSEKESWDNDKAKFAQTYIMILHARELGGDSLNARRRVDSILAQSGYTEQSFEKFFNNYSRNPALMRGILDSAQAFAQRKSLSKP